MQLDSALPGSKRPVMLCTVYLPPRVATQAAAAEADERWFQQLEMDIQAAGSIGVPLVLGDFNARTASEPDWPEDTAPAPPRQSLDTATTCQRGQRLLQLCRELGMRICNGRGSGTNASAATSFGVNGKGKAVVDYALVPADMLPLATLSVIDTAVGDHAALLLLIAAPPPRKQPGKRGRQAAKRRRQRGRQQCSSSSSAAQRAASARRPRRPPPPADPRWARFHRDDQRAEVAAASLAADPKLHQLIARAQAANSATEIDSIGKERCELLVAHMAAAGLRRKAAASCSNGTLGDQLAPPQQPRMLVPMDIQDKWQLADLQRQQKHLSSKQPGSDAHIAVRSQYNRARKAARQEARQRLEQQVFEDPASFASAFNTRTSSHSVPQAAQERHVERLLAPAVPAASPEPQPTPNADQPSPPQPISEEEQALLAAMDAPFTVLEVTEAAVRVPQRKSVIGPLAPWLLRPAADCLAPLLAAEFAAWRRASCLPSSDARSDITNLPKPGAKPGDPAGLRGIAIGTQAAKLYATLLERRLSAWAEGTGRRADGQFGFRRNRSTAQAALVLRTLQDRYRAAAASHAHDVHLWACFVDFKQAFDRVPRSKLWQRLKQIGVGSGWLAAAQAIYADVPMTVAGGQHVISTTIGVKQGCPLSPTLFGLYIDAIEAELQQAVQNGLQLALAELAPSQAVAVLLYADDLALLATSAAGLQAQLDILERFCKRLGLTVNLVKTKVMLLAGEHSSQAALTAAQNGKVSFAGERLPVVSEFRYLGIMFSSSRTLAAAAAPGRCTAARLALLDMRARCSFLELQSARVQLHLFHSLVDSKLSYGSEVWAPHLAALAARRAVVSGSAGTKSAPSEPELLHQQFLRSLLGVRHATPVAVVQAETGQLPLYIQWLKRTVRFWNSIINRPESSLERQALACSIQLAASSNSSASDPWGSWAAQLAAGLQAVGIEFDAMQPQPLCPHQVEAAALQRHLQLVADATAQDGRSRLQHYFSKVCGGGLSADSYGAPAYLAEVNSMAWRQPLAQLRTGSHWGEEEKGRFEGRQRSERLCPHCQQLDGPGGIEDVHHMCFDCPLYAAARQRRPELLFAGPPSLHFFFNLPSEPLARFAADIYHTHKSALTKSASRDT